ncbi:hypothetical protein SGPA1_20762 [Streptomyces misionensis JCM 4497]
MGVVPTGRARDGGGTRTGRRPTTSRGPRMSGGDRVRGHLRVLVAAVATGLRAGLAHGLPALRPLDPGPGLGSPAPRHPR